MLRAFELAHHVPGDGVSLYYYNCAEHLRPAIAGLRRLGFSAAATQMNTGLKILLPGADSPQPKDMRKAVESMSDKQQKLLEPIERALDKLAPSIMRRAEAFMAANPALFR